MLGGENEDDTYAFEYLLTVVSVVGARPLLPFRYNFLYSLFPPPNILLSKFLLIAFPLVRFRILNSIAL